MLSAPNLPAAVLRGRPSVNVAHTTLVADNGHLLRGVFISTEDGRLPARESLQALKAHGFNALHCYAECAAAGRPAGYQAQTLDQLVAWTREDGLYLVLTIGNCEAPINAAFTTDFWRFYAGRYRGEQHVIYEIQNEPAKSPGLKPAILDLEKNAFRIIRAQAPETPVLLFSYQAFDNGAKVLKDIQALNGVVDWQREAVGFHGYGPGGREACRHCLMQVLQAGYPCFQTEFYTWPWGVGMTSFTSSQSWFQDVDETGDFERLGVSWLSFLSPPQAVNAQRFQDRIQHAGISWVPDFGAWPAIHRQVHGREGEPWTVSNLTDALRIPAASYDDGGSEVSWHLTADPAALAANQRPPMVALQPSDWVEYTAYIKHPGTYDLALHFVANLPTNNLQVSFGGAVLLKSWEVLARLEEKEWRVIHHPLNLPPGQQVLRLGLLAGSIKVDWLELSPQPVGELADGLYRIINRDNRQVLSLPRMVTNGVRVFPGLDDNARPQLWQVHHLGGNEYQITWAGTKKSLDAVNSERRNGSRIGVWDYANTANQHWLITPTDHGFFTIAAAHSGLGLAIRNNPGTQLDMVCQAQLTGAAAGQWSFQTP